MDCAEGGPLVVKETFDLHEMMADDRNSVLGGNLVSGLGWTGRQSLCEIPSVEEKGAAVTC